MMKRLILASSGQFVTSYPGVVFPKGLKNSRMAYIITASKKVLDRTYLHRHKRNMDEAGFQYATMDIDGMQERELESRLRRFDVIYVEEGNTFFLLKAARESGFGFVMPKLLAKGVVYAGSSAGAYIACPSIVMATWSSKEFDRCGIRDFSGMSLVNFLVKAHYTPDEEAWLKKKANGLDYPLYALNDDQALLVNGAKVTLLGGGKKIVWSSRQS